MKKILLIPALAVTVFCAKGEVTPPVMYEDVCINALSPDGKIAVSEIYGNVQIINLETGDRYVYEYNDMKYPVDDYSIGFGHCVSNNGVVTGGSGLSDAQYWKDGEWHLLGRGESTGTCLSNGITSDGNRICGSIGKVEADNGDDALRSVPVIWEWNGSQYGDPIILPHPTHDITGRVAQLCTAVEISDDGKTVVGQVVDGFGLMRYPIVYREGEDGVWTYEIVHPELLNPNNITMPVYPGDGPEYPMLDNYMTEAQIDALYEALNAYYTENPDAPEMDMADVLEFAKQYMDPEKYEVYKKEVDIYMEWYVRLDEWNALYDEICESAPRYIFNDIHMNPEGNAFAINVDYGSPYIFRLDSDLYTEYTSLGYKLVSYFASKGRLLMHEGVYSGSSSILEGDNLEDLGKWIAGKVPAYGDWMKENNFSYGVATATPDLSKIGIWMPVDDDYIYAVGTVFDMAAGAGVECLGAESTAGSSQAYDIHGRAVKDISSPGVYIINGKKVMTGK